MFKKIRGKAGSNIIKKLEKKDKDKRKEKEKNIKKREQRVLTTTENYRLEVVAYDLSRRYQYGKLMMASNKKTAEKGGRDVHGYMKRTFPDYEWLWNNDVFDLACYFAMKDYRPEVFNIIKNYDFDNAIINVIQLPEKTWFDIYPDFEFDKIIILTQGAPFENAVHWIENYPWVDEDGYDTTMTLAPCNLLNMGFTLWDLPVTILKDAVGKDKLFFEAKTTADELISVKEQLLKKHIYTKRQEEKTINEKYDELEISYDQLDERHHALRDEIRAGDPSSGIEKLKKFDLEYNNDDNKEFNYEKFIKWVVIIILITLLVIGIIFLVNRFNLIQIPTEPPEIPGLLNLFNIRGS